MQIYKVPKDIKLLDQPIRSNKAKLENFKQKIIHS